MAENKITFKKYFITGLITILPLWLSLSVLWIAFEWISGFMSPILNPFFRLIFGPEDGRMISRILSFIITVFAIWSIGYMTTRIIGRRFLLWVEHYFLKLPFLREVYLGFRKLFQYLFVQKKAFRKVVLVEFPKQGSYTIGFVTMDSPKAVIDKVGGEMVNVFVPTSPNVTTGYLLLEDKKNLVSLDISVDDAIKFVLSGGIIRPEDTVSGGS